MSWVAVDHSPHHQGSDGRRWILRGLIIFAVAAGMWWLHGRFSDVTRLPDIQRVVLVNPAPPPRPDPPPEPEKQVEERQVETQQQQQVQTPLDNALGLNDEGGGVGDDFGLAGKPGGREITTIAPEPPPLAKAIAQQPVPDRRYLGELQLALQFQLNRNEALRKQGYRATIELWLDDDGRITRMRFLQGTGMGDVDERLRAALTGLATGAPPKAYPQPIRVVFESIMPGQR